MEEHSAHGNCHPLEQRRNFRIPSPPSRLQRSPVRSMFTERSSQEEISRIFFLQNAFHAQSLQTRLDAGGAFALSISHPGTWEIQGSQVTGLDLIGEPAGGGILSANHLDKKRLAIIEANGCYLSFANGRSFRFNRSSTASHGHGWSVFRLLWP